MLSIVQIAINAVLSTVSVELRNLRPIKSSYLPERYRIAFDEIKRLLVVVGGFQPEMLKPPKGGEARHDLLCMLTPLPLPGSYD